jgi:hypothetical protein
MEAMPAREVHRLGEKDVGDFVLKQARLVFAVRRGIEGRFVHRQVHEPGEEQAGLQPRVQRAGPNALYIRPGEFFL